MAQEPFQKAVLTKTAHDTIADRVATGNPIPKISYFIPVCNESVLEKDADNKVIGVTAPKSDPLNFNPNNSENNLEEIAAYRLIDKTDVDNPVDFIGDFAPEDITRTLANGANPANLRIRIKKEVNEYAIGGNAHVFYICDESYNVWITIHITPHSFTAGQKWEIITDTGISNPESIKDLKIVESDFDFTMASEVLLPKVIIGTDEDKSSGKAGYATADFEGTNPPIAIEHQRITFLENVAPLTKDVTKSADDLEFAMETPNTVLPLANHTLSLTGDNIRGHLRVSGAVDNGIVLSGNQYNLTIISDNDNCVDASAAKGLIVLNGRYVGTPEVPTAENVDSSNQIASTEFVQNQLAYHNVLHIKGSFPIEGNWEYPAAEAGDFYIVTETGTIGGPAGVSVEPQDTLLCIENTLAGDHAGVGHKWILGQVNTDVDLLGVIREHLATHNIVRLKGTKSGAEYNLYPAADAGDMYVIEDAGRIGGASGPQVEKNDTIMCLKDDTEEGDHASVGKHWMIGQVSTDLNLGSAFSSYLTFDKTDHGWSDADIGKMVIKTVGAGGAGDFATASADNVHSAEVVGHISKIVPPNQFTINRIGHLYRSATEWDALCGCGASGLTEGDVYFLNTSGGTFYTKDVSHLLPGNIDMPAFIALSATDVWYYGYRGAEVGGGTSFGKSFAATDFSGNVMTVTHGLNTKRPIIRVFDENDQPVEAIQSRPTIGNELNAQDITFSDEMITEMSSTLWHVIVIGTGVPYTKTEIDIPDYEPVAQQHGVKILPNGAIYSFDDWHGVEGFLTGNHGFVVPYKQSLSNVFTGFEVVGWRGNGSNQTIELSAGAGLNWIKSRETTQDHSLVDLLRGKKINWYSDLSAPQAKLDNILSDYNVHGYEISIDGKVNSVDKSYISWNWHYPMAKAWHAPGAGSRKVPTPWGMVDSVEANPNSGLTGDKVVTELYNPLTGNGCLVYIGTGVARTLDISGGIAPELLIAKVLSAQGNPIVYHSGLNGGTNPGQYCIYLNSNGREDPVSTIWTTEPDRAFISVGTAGSGNNESGELNICYYFAPIAGLQNIGGYTGNGGVNNQATGCKDGMFFTKMRASSSSGSSNWNVYDSIRGNDNRLTWNLTAVEAPIASLGFNVVSGIEINSTDAQINGNGEGYIYGHFGNQLIPQGNFDVYPSNPILANSSNNRVTIIFEYKGGATLNNELLIYATREPTPNWVQGTLTKLTDLADGYQLLSADIDISGNANNTHMRWRLASNESTHTEHNIKNLKITWS